MWTLVGSFALNIVLDAIFILMLDMGVAGAALAMLISQIAALAVYAAYFARRAGTVQIHPRWFSPTAGLLRQISSVGASVTLSHGVTAVAFVLIYRSAGAYGEQAVAAIGVALRLLTGGTLPIVGFCLGAQPVLGFGWGRRDYERTLRVLWRLLLIVGVFGIVYASVMIIFAPAIMALFTDDREVAEIGVRACQAFHMCFALSAVRLVTLVFLQAAGKAKLAAWLILAPHGYLFRKELPVNATCMASWPLALGCCSSSSSC